MRTVRRFLAAAFLLAVTVGPAAALETEHEGWFQVTATGPVRGRLRAFVEMQPRFGEDPQDGDFDVRALVARGALGWQVTEGWSLWAGYGYTPVYDPDRDENRIFQQSQYDRKFGPFHASHRLRLEQRFLEHESEASWRLRNQIRVTYPLPRWPSWSLVLADEVFVDLNTVDDGPESGFDQNRLFVGVSHQFTPHVRVEVDYLNQAVHSSPNKEDILRHSAVLQVALGW